MESLLNIRISFLSSYNKKGLFKQSLFYYKQIGEDDENQE